MDRLIVTFDSTCRKHWITVTRMCVANWTPQGTSVRVENGSKTALVMPQTVTDEEAITRAWDEVVQPLIEKGFEFGNRD